MAGIIGNVYSMEKVTVTPREFQNSNGENVFFFEIVGEIGGCRQKLKATVDRTFFLDFLAYYCKPIGKAEG